MSPVVYSKPRKLLLLLSTPRSGSYYACELLQRTGELGTPREFSPEKDTRNWQRALGFEDYNSYVDNIVPFHSTPNHVCTLKIMRFQFEAFLRLLKGSDDSPKTGLLLGRTY